MEEAERAEVGLMRAHVSGTTGKHAIQQHAAKQTDTKHAGESKHKQPLGQMELEEVVACVWFRRVAESSAAALRSKHEQ